MCTACGSAGCPEGQYPDVSLCDGAGTADTSCVPCSCAPGQYIAACGADGAECRDCVPPDPANSTRSRPTIDQTQLLYTSLSRDGQLLTISTSSVFEVEFPVLQYHFRFDTTVLRYGNGDWNYVSNLNQTFDSQTFGGQPKPPTQMYVSQSANGSRIAFGLPYEQYSCYEYNNGVWRQLNFTGNGPFAPEQVTAQPVALSGDGNRWAIRRPTSTNKYSEYFNEDPNIRVYEYDGEVWRQVGQNITYAKNAINSHSLALSGDGMRLAIGERDGRPSGLPQAGVTRVYDLSGGDWVQLGDETVGEAHDNSGASVALSEDGQCLVVGAPEAGADWAGRARVYHLHGAAWTRKGADIVGEPGDKSGTSVGVSADCNRVVVGAPGYPNGTGYGVVRVYDYGGIGQWVQAVELSGAQEAGKAGSVVGLSGDGAVLATFANSNPRRANVFAPWEQGDEWGVQVHDIPKRTVCPQGECWDVSLCPGDTYADVSGCTPCSTTCSSGYFLDGCDGSWTAGPEQCTACTCPEGRYISNTACPGTTLTNGAECTKCGAGCTLGQYVNLTLCTGSTTSDVSCVDCDPSFECSEGEFIKGCDGGVKNGAVHCETCARPEPKSPRREVVRSSAGVYAIYPPFLGSFAYDTPGYGTGCPTPCKIIILGEKMIPQ